MLWTDPTNLAPALMAFHTSRVFENLLQAVPEEGRPSLKHWDGRLKDTFAWSLADGEERLEALQEDRQGLSVLRQRPTGSS
jgi:hypothetical protein